MQANADSKVEFIWEFLEPDDWEHESIDVDKYNLQRYDLQKLMGQPPVAKQEWSITTRNKGKRESSRF